MPRPLALALLLLGACADDDIPASVIVLGGSSAGQGGSPLAGSAGSDAGHPADPAGHSGSLSAAGHSGSPGAGQGGLSGSSGQGGAPVGGAGAGGAAAGVGGVGGVGGAGAASGAAGGSGGGASEPGPTRYVAGVRHSPMTAPVVAKLKGVLGASAGQKGVFAKVGASNTVNTNFFHCFAGGDVKLGENEGLGTTVDFFKQTALTGGKTSFDRTSLAATVGWGASKTVEGSPSPIEQEVAAINPAFAVVLLGTNDTYEQGVVGFDANLLKAIDLLLSLGVVPLLTTIPPRADKAEAEALVPEMNAIVRAIAQQRQVPFLDLWSLLEPLPDKGLVSDGIHLGVYSSGGKARGCWLTPEALGDGMNLRNLISLEALDRARSFLLSGEPSEPGVPPGGKPPELGPPPLAGAGTWADPYVVDALPFVDSRDTSQEGTSVAGVYSCATANEGGPEVIYRVPLAAPTKLSVRVFDGAGVDVDIHALDAPDAQSCLERDDRRVVLTAGPGDLFLAVDTYVSASGPQAGPYRLTVVPIP